MNGAEGGGGGTPVEKTSLTDVQAAWNLWEIHLLILVSLFLQVVLFFLAGIRRRSSSSILRGLLWLAYLSADSVAIFVLGHLMVHAQGSRHHLMYFWAPFVLVHLGGQDSITAFAKQDNELWRRHLLNLVTQVAVAVYVVAKASWPDRRLRAAMVIMFLSGSFKYVERTVCLYISSPQNLRSSLMKSLNLTVRTMSKTLDMFFKYVVSRDAFYSWERVSKTLDMLLKGNRSFAEDVSDTMSEDAPCSEGPLIQNRKDVSKMLAEFKSREGHCGAYKCVEASLVQCYQKLHTKAPVRELFMEGIIFLFSVPDIDDFISFLIVTLMLLYSVFQLVSAPIALVLFMAAEKGDQRRTSTADITVSYILLVGAIVLDTCSFLSSLMRYLPEGRIKRAVLRVASCIQPAWRRKHWSEELAQYTIIRTAALLSGKPSIWQLGKKLAARLLDIGTVTYTSITKYHTPIKEVLLDYLLCLGANSEWDVTSSRGKLALKKLMNKQQDQASTETKKEALEKHIINNDFPISALIFHIATEMCYYHEDRTNENVDGKNKKDNKQVSMELSNYIMYLVFKCGVMRTTNSQLVHDNACEEIRKILREKCQQVTPQDEKNVVKELFEQNEEEQRHSSTDEHQKPEEQSNEQQDSNQNPEEQSDAQDYTVVPIRKTEESGEQQDSTPIEPNITVKPTEQTNSNMEKRMKDNIEALASPVLPRAREVARELLGVEDTGERWSLIVEVWLEMLFYVARRCGGAFHYERLSTGGEFVTHVLVLMKLLGPFLPPPGA